MYRDYFIIKLNGKVISTREHKAGSVTAGDIQIDYANSGREVEVYQVTKEEHDRALYKLRVRNEHNN